MSINTIVDEYIKWTKENKTTFTNTPKRFITALAQNNYQFNMLFRQKIKESKKTQYYYQIVFTLKDGVNDSEDVIEDYIKKQFRRKPLQVVKAYICKEYQKNGKAHWHVAVQTTKFLKKDRFNYYIRKYGMINITKSKHKTLDNSLNYMAKDGLYHQIEDLH